MHADTRTVTSVALAVACVVAVAAAADGFESLTTDPEDLVDPGFDRLPVGEGEMESLRDEVVSRQGSSAPRPKPSDSGEQSAESAAESSAEREATTESESRDESQAESQQRSTRSDGAGDDGSQPPPDERDWRLLLALLAALAVAGALGYRYVGRAAADDADPPAFGDADPESEVERAWLKLVRRVDADRPESRTPGEWAAAAVDAGLDADAVTTLTRTFESVRYGGDDATEERRRRVRRALDRLDARYGTDGGERSGASRTPNGERSESLGSEPSEAGRFRSDPQSDPEGEPAEEEKR
jgi:hypothetical protein